MNDEDPPVSSMILPPINIPSAEVLEFPMSNRKPVDTGAIIKIVDKKHYGVCQHENYLYDEEKADVECAECHEKLNPMWVLQQLSRHESALHRRHLELRTEIETIKPKLSQKCEHCGKMTKIKSKATSAEVFQKRIELEYGKRK